MSVTSILKNAVPVIVGIAIFGLTANALRGNSFVKQIISGFDA